MKDTEKRAVSKISRMLAVVPPLRDYPSRREWETACWRRVSKSQEMLQLLTTYYERHNLVMRAAALKELTIGKGQRQISRELFLSLQTINGVKKAMAENSYRSYLERSKKERRKKKYSASSPSSVAPRHRGRPVRTKYGKIYMPY